MRGVVHGLDVAAFLAGLCVLSHGGLYFHHGVHDACGGVSAEAGVLKLVGDELLVGLAHFGVALVVLEVVVAVAEAHASSAEVHGIFI